MFIITILIVLSQFNKVSADSIQLPDSHAPISVMGDHTHRKKEVMFSYRFMNMQMGKLFNNNKKLSKDAVMSAPNGASDGSGSYMNAPKSNRRKAIDCQLIEESKSNPGYFKYMVTIQESDGTINKQPAYGIDMQDAMKRLVRSENAEMVVKVIEKKQSKQLISGAIHINNRNDHLGIQAWSFMDIDRSKQL